MSHEVESMVSVRDVPWHGLGTIVSEYMTAEECIQAAGLDWSVSLEPIFVNAHFPDDPQIGAYTPVDGRQAIVRQSDGQVYEIVSDQYVPIQNADAFGFLDEMVNHGSGRAYDTAGSLKGGRQVFLAMKLAELRLPGLNDEVIENYLVVSTSHDRSLAFSAMVTPVRVVCQNTLNFALARNKGRWITKHLAEPAEQVKEAQRALGLVDDYLAEFNDTIDALANVQCELDTFEELVRDVFPAKNVRQGGFSQEQYGMIGLYESSPNLEHVERTGWRALNAITEWDQWGRALRVPKDGNATETQLTQTWFGDNPKRAERVVKHLLRV